MKTIILGVLVIFLFNSENLSAQTWSPQSAPAGTANGLNGAWACDANVVWMCGPSGVVIRTTNGGITWTMANNGLAGYDFYTIAATDANTAEAGGGDGSMWRTTNGGSAWIRQILTPTPVFMDVIHFFDSNTGFALSDPAPSAGLWLYYITTDAGANWSAGANRPPNIAGEYGYNGSYSALDTGHIWWGTNVSRIWKGSLRGPYTPEPTNPAFSFSVGFNDALTGLAGLATIARTTDGGATWTSIGFTPDGNPYAMKYVPGTGFCWLGSQTIYRTANSGDSWNIQLTLSAANNCQCLTMVNVNTGWAGTHMGQIFKYHDIVGIDPNNTSVPQNFSLMQNYPNPFNPTTNIRYSIPVASQVSIKIYDALGNEVRTLVNEYRSVGNNVESFSASNLASGIYFYTLRAGDYVQTKKMALIK